MTTMTMAQHLGWQGSLRGEGGGAAGGSVMKAVVLKWDPASGTVKEVETKAYIVTTLATGERGRCTAATAVDAAVRARDGRYNELRDLGMAGSFGQAFG